MQNKNNPFGIFKIFALVTAVVSLALAVYRIVVLKDNLELNVAGFDYYLDRSFNVTLFDILAGVCAMLLFITGAVLGRKAKGEFDYNNGGTIFMSALCGFMTFSTGAYFLYRYFSTDGIYEKADLIPLILLIASAAAFFYAATGMMSKRPKIYGALMLLPIILYCARVFTEYSEQKHNPSQAIMVLHILSMLSLILFFVQEGKFSISRGSPALYCAFGALCVALLFVSSIPMLVLSAFWMLPLSDSVMYEAVDLVFALYILIRISAVIPEYDE